MGNDRVPRSAPGPAGRDGVNAGARSLRARRGRTWPLSVAPMMDRTDRHFRWFLRRITRRTLLYTEMVTTAGVLHGDRDHLLGFDPEERPLALQLGGDGVRDLASCARIAAGYGYDEINLNVGCPSDRVRQGNFGVCLMGDPPRVAEAVAAMRDAVDLPVTVKHRIGYDDRDRYEDMLAFVDRVARAGCDRFAVHARKAWLTGLSPKQNRSVPPLRHGDVHRLKRDRPDLTIEINGGIRALAEVRGHLAHVDGVMVGRAAYDDPYAFATADRELFGDERRVPGREEIAGAMLPYVERHLSAGGKLGGVTRHLLALYAGRPGARVWRRELTEGAVVPGAGAEVVERALAAVRRSVGPRDDGAGPTDGVV